METTFTIWATVQDFTAWTNHYGEAYQHSFTHQARAAVLFTRSRMLWHPVKQANGSAVLGWVKFAIQATEDNQAQVTARLIGAEYHAIKRKVDAGDGWIGEEWVNVPFKSKEIAPELEQYYQAMMQAIRRKWQAGAAEPELPPRPGDDGVTWDDAFDWYHRNRDKCGSLKQLAALVAYDFGTVRNRHAEYQAQRK